MSLSLNHLLTYKNDRLLARYTKDYPDAKMNADDALHEFLKYVWLCVTHRQEKYYQPANPTLHFSCVMHDEMREIDNMWHTFLLFTRDYHAFCQEYLNGNFFHHEPLSQNDNINVEKFEIELTNYLSYIHEKLGEETLLKWFSK
jgi:hypothetical protein